MLQLSALQAYYIMGCITGLVDVSPDIIQLDHHHHPKHQTDLGAALCDPPTLASQETVGLSGDRKSDPIWLLEWIHMRDCGTSWSGHCLLLWGLMLQKKLGATFTASSAFYGSLEGKKKKSSDPFSKFDLNCFLSCGNDLNIWKKFLPAGKKGRLLSYVVYFRILLAEMSSTTTKTWKNYPNIKIHPNAKTFFLCFHRWKKFKEIRKIIRTKPSFHLWSHKQFRSDLKWISRTFFSLASQGFHRVHLFRMEILEILKSKENYNKM